jgi:hypothetical protein
MSTGTTVAIRAPDGMPYEVYMAGADSPPRPAIMIFSPIFGVNIDIKTLADRWANIGRMRNRPFRRRLLVLLSKANVSKPHRIRARLREIAHLFSGYPGGADAVSYDSSNASMAGTVYLAKRAIHRRRLRARLRTVPRRALKVTYSLRGNGATEITRRGHRADRQARSSNHAEGCSCHFDVVVAVALDGAAFRLMPR